MHPIQEHLIRTSAALPEDEIAAIVAHLQRLSYELRVITTSVQLRAPGEPGAELLGAAAEYLETIAAFTTPAFVRHEAAAQLRGLMHIAGQERPPTDAAPAPDIVWEMLAMLAEEAAAATPHRRDRQVLRRVCSIAARELAQRTQPGEPVATGRLVLVHSDAPGEAP